MGGRVAGANLGGVDVACGSGGGGLAGGGGAVEDELLGAPRPKEDGNARESATEAPAALLARAVCPRLLARMP